MIHSKKLWVLLVAFVHFGILTMSIMYGEIPDPSKVPTRWKIIAEIFDFPLLYLPAGIGGYLPFPILEISNSILWGVGCVWIFLYLKTRNP